MPLLLKLMSEREGRGKSNNAVLVLIVVMCLWSFALLTQGPTQYYTYRQLVAGVSAAFENFTGLYFFVLPAFLLGSGVLAMLFCGKTYSWVSLKNSVAALLLLLLVHYQVTIFFHDTTGMLVCSLISLAIMSVVIPGYFAAMKTYQECSPLLERLFGALSLLCYFVLASVFANLTITTNQIMSAGLPAPLSYTTVSKVDVNEIRASALEYVNVPGFDQKKARLQAYLEYLDSGNDSALRR
jgi:hypothetical protein